MRSNTTRLFRAMARLLIVFLEVRLAVDISWNYSAARSRRAELTTILGAEMEDPPAPPEIRLTQTIAMMDLCISCSRC